MARLTLSVIVPTYQREEVLIRTLSHLLELSAGTEGFLELIVVDQTQEHKTDTEERLRAWNTQGLIRWLRLQEAHLTRSMNLGLLKGRGDVVLFTDDDIIPKSDLLNEHLRAYQRDPDIWAVVGQILQPGEEPEDISYTSSGSPLTRNLDFPFRGMRGTYVENAMAGNLSVIRKKALSLGGFDENFTPPVATRFETEFAKRLVAKGGKIWFEPRAGIHHLHFQSGGTRARGGHLNSLSPRYGVGDYYYALNWGRGWKRLIYVVRRPFREVITRFHLKNPWWIPLKFTGELLGIAQAMRLRRNGQNLIEKGRIERAQKDFELSESRRVECR